MSDQVSSTNPVDYIVNGTTVMSTSTTQLAVNLPMLMPVISSTSVPTSNAGFVYMYADDTTGNISVKNNSGVSVPASNVLPVTPVSGTSYSLLQTDAIVGITASGAFTLTLPASSLTPTGKWYYIIDQGGNAQTNNITINPTGSDTINGDTSLLLNLNNQAVSLYNVYTSGPSGAWYIF